MKQQKYTIELNREQLMLVANCLEDVSRLASGQMELNYTMEKILNTEFSKDFNKQMEVRDQVHEKLAEIKKILFPNMWTNESHGYNSTPFIGNVYQIYRSILHFLAVDEGWDNVYSGLTLKSGELGTVKITKK